MQFVYLDFSINGESAESEVLLNKANPPMSPILMWQRIIRISKYIDGTVLVCRAVDCEHYRNLIASEHISTVTIVSKSEIEDPAHPFTDKVDVVNRLRELNIIHAATIAICYDTCIPVKGLNLDYVIDYFLYKKAKGVYLYSYDNIRNLSEITADTKRSVAPFLVLNTDYLKTAKHSPYTLIALFAPSIYGMWIPHLPLGIHTETSLQRGIEIFQTEDRDLSKTPLTTSASCYSRIGLIGNPSDGYFGHTISISLDNHCTTVTLLKSEKLNIVPHPISDPLCFDDIRELHTLLQRNGYSGGLRLIYAALNRFYKFVMEKGIYINMSPFSLSYDTTIPREVGLSGSSSIIIATLRALLQYYNIPNLLFTQTEQIKWALSVETDELGITAGLQDRVVQVLEGCVMMDFDEELIKKTGNGRYEKIDVSLLPPLFLAYCGVPKDISYIDENQGLNHTLERSIRMSNSDGFWAINAIAKLPAEFLKALRDRDEKKMKDCVNRNFDLRRQIWGDEALGGEKGPNLTMIRIARKYGMAAKFCGSGGAVVIVPGFSYKEEVVEAMKKEMEANGFILEKVFVHEKM